ncbi:hypothetical protein [Scardovia wiggsiae]|uniref:hypothetical protein n=1 Tax=Scardovia wiggsiae TaxID=230143 RepID=UPI00374EE41A
MSARKDGRDSMKIGSSVSIVFKYFVTGIMISAVLSATACTPAPPVKGFSNITLEGVVAAISVNPQAFGQGIENVKEGYVALIKENGNYTVIRTSGMAAQELLWTKKGLYFSDRDSDYFIGKKSDGGWMSKRKADGKVPYQNFLVEDREGGAVAAFDLGFTDKVSNQLKIIPMFSSQKPYTITSRILSAAAFCGPKLVGITAEENNSDKVHPDIEARDYVTLKDLSKDSGNISVYDSGGRSFNVISYGNAVCRTSQLFSILSERVSETTEKLFLLKWNIISDEKQLIPIMYKDGRQLNLSNAGIFQDRYSLVDNDTFVFAARQTGSLFSIDVNTGVVKKRFSPENLPLTRETTDEGNIAYSLRITKKYFYILFVGFGERNGRAHITVINKKSWKIERTITFDQTLSDLLRGRNHKMSYADGYAVNPEL